MIDASTYSRSTRERRLLGLVTLVACFAVAAAAQAESTLGVEGGVEGGVEEGVGAGVEADVDTTAATDEVLPDVSPSSEPDPFFYDDDFDFDDIAMGFPDPFESPNRGILAVNQVLDKFLLDPVTRLYRLVFPEPVRRCFYRFFDNINSPQALVNDMFQLEWEDAANVTARLLINSTVGIGGLFDPAKKWGLPQHKSDFGQTLAIAGMSSGPYFVLPILGPTTVRSGIGLGVDAIFHPTFFLLGGADVLIFTGSAGMTERARHFEELQALNESSIDFYAALRSGYYQNRVSEIWSRREDRRPSEGPNAPSDPFGDDL
jgi:phospholipid-binding lipoprotein MlaA